MAWPKGVKRPKPESSIPGPVALGDLSTETIVSASRPAKPTSKDATGNWKMRAGNNWDGVVMEDDVTDRFFIHQDQFPEGMDLQWVTETVFGQATQRLGKFEKNGWTPVHYSDFDGRFDTGRWAPKGTDDYVRDGGVVLCARPLAISLDRKAQDRRAAKQQVQMREESIMAGGIDASGADHPSARKFNHITRTVERVDVPKD